MSTKINKKNVRKAIKSLVGARLCDGELWDGRNFCAVGHLGQLFDPPPGPWKEGYKQESDAHKAITKALGCSSNFSGTFVSVNDDSSFPKSLSRVERLRRGLQALLSKKGAERYVKMVERSRETSASDVREELECMGLVNPEPEEPEITVD